MKSPRTARRYLGPQVIKDTDGFVDTGDMVELRGQRCFFAGRRDGVINVGGLKVYPEEIEAVIHRHPQVKMALVGKQQSPITGALVVAEVVLREAPDANDVRRPGARRSSNRRFWSCAGPRSRGVQGAGDRRGGAGALRRADRKAAAAMKNVIVTGGSRGLGLAIARRLVAAGYRVLAIARNSSEPLAALIAESEAVRPGSLHFASADLTALETIPGLVRDLRSRFGPFHGLVNNAGSSLDGALMALMPDADIERLVRLNTVSPIILTKYVVRSMMAHGGGRVINIASIVGFTGYSGLAAYGATKASLLGFTRSLAREVGRAGINVNAIAPGFVETELTSGLTGKQREQIARRSALKRLDRPRRRRRCHRVPPRRWGKER